MESPLRTVRPVSAMHRLTQCRLTPSDMRLATSNGNGWLAVLDEESSNLVDFVSKPAMLALRLTRVAVARLQRRANSTTLLVVNA